MSLKGENVPTISVQTLETESKQTESFHIQVGKTIIIMWKVTIRKFYFLKMRVKKKVNENIDLFFLTGSQAGCWSLS